MAYGGPECKCCGEDHLMMLQVDHINGGGTQHRKEIGGCVRFYPWLKANNFPPGYQILCANCNVAKYLNGGVCPHEEERQALKTPSMDDYEPFTFIA